MPNTLRAKRSKESCSDEEEEKGRGRGSQDDEDDEDEVQHSEDEDDDVDNKPSKRRKEGKKLDKDSRSARK